jgi:hypothetical protein
MTGVEMGTRVLVAVLLAGVGGCAAGEGGVEAGPVDLRFALENGGLAAYTAEYEQDVLVDMGDHAMEAGRRYGARYTITGAGVRDGRHEGSVRLDSLDIAITTAQGRQAFDTRHLIGGEFTMTVGEAGGAPGYGGEVPAIDLGPMLGGEVGPTLLMDYGFPQLPDHPVSAGDTWEGTSTRSHIEGILEVSAHLASEYTFAGWETVGGVECVRIEASITGDLLLVQMDGEESTEGVMTSESVNAPVRQHTTVHIRSVAGS